MPHGLERSFLAHEHPPRANVPSTGSVLALTFLELVVVP